MDPDVAPRAGALAVWAYNNSNKEPRRLQTDQGSFDIYTYKFEGGQLNATDPVSEDVITSSTSVDRDYYLDVGGNRDAIHIASAGGNTYRIEDLQNSRTYHARMEDSYTVVVSQAGGGEETRFSIY